MREPIPFFGGRLSDIQGIFLIKALVLALPFILLLVSRTEAIDLASVGSYGETINAADLVGGAGSDLNSTYQSTTDAVTLTVSNSFGGNWAIDVRKSDTTWNGNFVLKVKKTTGTAITRLVGNTDVEFFQGSGDGSFNVEVILEGVSIAVAPDNYSATIICTVRGL